MKEFNLSDELQKKIEGKKRWNGRDMAFIVEDVKEFIRLLLEEMPYEREFIKKLAGDKLI